MKLKDLLKHVQLKSIHADLDMEVDQVVYDSRKATPGCMFVAVAGFAADGNRFISMAVEKGAKVIVTARRLETSVPYVVVESDRLALATISANYFGSPAATMTMIGVTGTNGKTSTTLLLKHVIEKTLGAKVGLIGTMENLIGSQVIPTERTTPESYELQALFARMRDAGCTYVIMEVSSHALALDRVGGVHYDVAAFTNLTEDHLDFHETMENYCDAKAMLFGRCDKAVMNGDDAWFARMSANAHCPALTTSVSGKADLWASDVQMFSDGVSFKAHRGDHCQQVHLPIPGKFTVYNALSVLGCALQLGIPMEKAAAALATASGVKGRVEVVPTPGRPYTVLIDYAHTPDGLENVLSSVKDFCKGRLIAVFGCGGDRDRTKRPIMGKIGTEIADFAIITSDNPRTEVPGDIIKDIVAGVDAAKKNYEVIENRIAAIHHAMDIAKKDDIIVLAGKGHETYQEIHGIKHHLDEREVVAQYVSETGNIHE